MRARVLPLALSAALSVLPTAAYADEPEWSGYTCGLGSLALDGTYDGMVTAGWWHAADTTANGVNIVIHCSVQVNQADYGGPANARASCYFFGHGVAQGRCLVEYTADSTDNVYLCTHVEMHHGSGTSTYTYDEDDNPANGSQCALAINFGNGHYVGQQFVTSLP